MSDGNIIQNHEKRIGKLEVKTGKIEVRVGNLEGIVNSTEETVSSIEKSINEVKEELAGLRAGLKWSMTTVSTLSALVGGLIVYILTHTL